MTPHYIELRNFIGIRSGMGIDTLILDLDDISQGSQIIALHGENGKGKTTIMDNLHPYRLMPSRASSYSPGSFSYYDETFDNAQKIFKWSHNGSVYRSTINIKGANKTKKTEAYLHIKDGDDWKPAPTGEGSATSDGKTITYDKAVVYALGTPEMFFTSAFAAQNRAQLSGYTNSEIKSLMTELLGLDDIQYLGDQSSTIEKSLTAELNGLNAIFQARENLIKELTDAIGILGQYSNEKAAINQNLKPLQAQYDQANTHLMRVRADNVTNADIEAQREKLTQDLDNAEKQGNERLKTLSDRLVDLQGDLTSKRQRHENESNTVNQQIEQIDKNIEVQHVILGQRDEILEAVETFRKCETDLQAIGIKIAENENNKETRDKYQRAVDEIERCLVATRHQLVTAENKLLSTQKQASLIDEVPCNGMDIQPNCQLLASAVNAREVLPAIETEINQIHLQIDEQEERKRKGNEALEPFKLLDDERKFLDDELAAVMLKKNSCQELQAKQNLLDNALNTANQYKTSKENLLCYLNNIKNDFDSEIIRLDNVIAEQQNIINQATLENSQALLSIQQSLESLPTLDGDDPLKEAESTFNQAKTNLDAEKQKADELQPKLIRQTVHVESLQKTIDESDDLPGKIAHIKSELSEWKLLSKALGRDGIIALSIDDAGPTIAGLANDLLLSCYGPRFTVAIDTQTQTGSGALKETFDITVFDAERDEKKSIRKMSGGERIWINEAITRAIALFQAQQSGQSYKTLFTDESDGALDPKRKVMFFNMKKQVLKLGGYEREYFISHTPELIDMADAVIDLSELERQSAA